MSWWRVVFKSRGLLPGEIVSIRSTFFLSQPNSKRKSKQNETQTHSDDNRLEVNYVSLYAWISRLDLSIVSHCRLGVGVRLVFLFNRRGCWPGCWRFRGRDRMRMRIAVAGSIGFHFHVRIVQRFEVIVLLPFHSTTKKRGRKSKQMNNADETHRFWNQI